jgi:hypothetical protein
MDHEAPMTLAPWLRYAAGLVGISALILAVSAWLVLRSMSPLSRCDDRKFSSAKWKDTAAAFSGKAMRGCLVDDLMRSHQLRGLSRREVVALLGDPPKTRYFRDYDLVY